MEHLITTDPDSVLISRFKGNFRLQEEGHLDDKVQRLGLSAIVDTETTGVSAHDTVIELAIQPFAFDRKTGALLEVFEPFNQLQDPLRPLSEEVKAITGIDDALLKGQSIDWQAAAARLEPCDFIIAHNAKFDRPMVHRGFHSAGKKPPRRPWVCSMSDIDWRKEDTRPPSVALGCLAAWYGFFFDAHRAIHDCRATLHLLDLAGKLSYLAQRSKQPSYIVSASGKVFDQKDMLKERRYGWDGDKKVWWKEVASAELAAAERTWMAEFVYARRADESYALAVSPEERFL